MKKLFFLVCAAGVVASCGLRAPRSQVSLVELLPQAAVGPLVGPRGNLGAVAMSALLGQGWGPLNGSPARLNQGKAEVLFSMTQLCAAEVQLEGRSLEAAMNVSLSVNGHALSSFAVDSGWKYLRLSLPANDLVEGLNRLEIAGSSPSQWRECQVRPQHAEIHAPAALTREDTLCLHYGTTREFPITLAGSELVLPEIAAWTQPGAAVPAGWQLTVRLQSAGVDTSWHLSGKSARLRLPGLVGTRAVLSLTASLPTDPLPGQLGVRLTGGVVESVEGAPAATSTPEPGFQAGAPPSVVLLYVIDTLRADHLHCYGYANATSPSIDALATDGVRFADCTTASSWTKPSVASLMTGMTARHHGTEDFSERLSPAPPTLAGLLGKKYQTRGLVTNPMIGPLFGFDRGFASFRLLQGAATSELVAAALPLLKSSVFLYLQPLDLHIPYRDPKLGNFSRLDAFALFSDWNAKKDVKARLTRALSLYDAGLGRADRGLGELVGSLKKQGLYDNAMIVVVSDHGEEFFEHGGLGHLRTLYPEVVRVPLIVKYPHGWHAGTVDNRPHRTIDVAPMVLAQAGLPVPREMDGGKDDGAIFFSINAGETGELFGEGVTMRRSHLEGVRVGRWVLNRAFSSHANAYEPEPFEVYDLESDPQERHNLAYSRPEIRVWLLSLLRAEGQRKKLASAPQVLPAERDRSLQQLQYAR